MLEISVPSVELFDETSDKFVRINSQTLKLEHSLVSISKWESKWCKPFLDDNDKTQEELLDYIRCMVIGGLKDDNILLALGVKELNQIIDYINAPMTATTVSYWGNERRKKEIVTSELIYYWMIEAGIPFECEKWHINRLFMLIKVCGAKSQANKKMSNAEAARKRAELNAKRRAQMKSKG